METLGVGTHRVMLTDRGGVTRMGDLSDITYVKWNRVRDDVSSAVIRVGTSNPACCQLLDEARTMRHEVVIYRNDVRVWEGVIIRLEFSEDEVEIEARDVMYITKRTVLNRDLTYSHPNVTSVIDATETALRIAFGDGVSDPFGWNVGKWLSPISGPDDPRTATVYPQYSVTIFDLVDNWAVYSGIDYVVLGRRIMWWDTHLRAHILPALDDSHFAESLVISEYGSELATRSFVTNGTGYAASANAPQQWLDYYGQLDQLVNNYEEAAGNDQPTDEEKAAMKEQAERDITSRYPAPVRLRLPGFVRMLPDTPVGINELIPGAWSYVRATRTCRKVSQWQKLDEVTVNEVNGVETVSVSLTQAPSKIVDP